MQEHGFLTRQHPLLMHNKIGFVENVTSIPEKCKLLSYLVTILTWCKQTQNAIGKTKTSPTMHSKCTINILSLEMYTELVNGYAFSVPKKWNLTSMHENLN